MFFKASNSQSSPYSSPLNSPNNSPALQITTKPVTLSWVIQYINNVWLGCIFYSILCYFCSFIHSFEQSLISQYETIYFIMFLTPILTGSTKLYNFFLSHSYILILISSSVFASVNVSNDVGYLHFKLFLTALSFGCILLYFSIHLSASSYYLRERTLYGFLNGLILYIVLKYSTFGQDALTIKPKYSQGAMGITILAAIIVYFDRRQHLVKYIINKAYSYFLNDTDSEDEYNALEVTTPKPKPKNLFNSTSIGPILNIKQTSKFNDDEFDEDSIMIEPDSSSISCIVMPGGSSPGGSTSLEGSLVASFSWIRTGFGLGSILFITHLWLTSHGILPRWADMDPFPQGLLIIFGMGISVLSMKSAIFHSGLTWIALAIGTILLFACTREFALLGGLLITFSCAPFWFLLISHFPNGPNQRFIVWLTAMPTYLVLYHFMASTVLYETLPLGSLFRDRPHIVVIMALLGLLISMGRRRAFSLPHMRIVFPPIPVIFSVLITSAIFIIPATIYRAQNNIENSPSTKIIPLNPPVGVVVLPGEQTFESPKESIEESWRKLNYSHKKYPIKVEANIQTNFHLACVDYDIQLGFGQNGGMVDFEVVLQFIRQPNGAPNPDVVAFQQSDTLRMWTGNRDAVEYLGYHASYTTCIYGLVPQRSSSGVALLTNYFAMAKSTDVINDGFSTSSEITPLLKSTLTAYYNKTSSLNIEFWVTRFSADSGQRYNQVTDIVQAISNLPSIPFIFAADIRVNMSDESVTALVDAYPNAYGTWIDLTHGNYEPTTVSGIVTDLLFYKCLSADFAAVDNYPEFTQYFDHYPINAVFSNTKPCS